MRRESDFRIWLLLYEKFLVAITVAIITAAFLYSYNINSKAFEVAESQSRSYSLIGARLRELVLNSVKAVHEIRLAYNYPDDANDQENKSALPKATAEKNGALALELERTSTLLLRELPRSAALAGTIATTMRESIVGFESGLDFTSQGVEAFEKSIGDLQDQFFNIYNIEIAALTIAEFKRFKEQFDKEIPSYLQPESVIAISILLLLFSTIAILWLNKSMPDSAKDPSS